MAKGIEYKSASFHVTEGKGLREKDEQALQKLGDEGWEIVQIVPRQETNWVLVVFSRPRGTPGEVVTRAFAPVCTAPPVSSETRKRSAARTASPGASRTS